MALTSRDWVVALQRSLWGVLHLSEVGWTSPAEASALVDVRVVAAQLFGEDRWKDYAAPGNVRQLAAAVRDIGERGEAEYLRRWYESAVMVCRLIFEQRRADLDAELAARAAELDAVWEATTADVLSLSGEALTELCRGAGELVAGAGEAAGRGLGAFLAGLFQSPVAVAAVAVGAWWLLKDRR